MRGDEKPCEELSTELRRINYQENELVQYSSPMLLTFWNRQNQKEKQTLRRPKTQRQIEFQCLYEYAR